MIKLGIYKHYKSDDEYRVLNLAIYENTEEEVVVYQAQYGEQKIYVRPLQQFEEKIEWNGKKVSRFTFIKN